MQERLPKKDEARNFLKLAPSAKVILWIGRLSILTKYDPWPTYSVLERIAKKFQEEIVLIECGPDDSPSQDSSLEKLRKLCPSVSFVRLGGDSPVEEDIKFMAIAASDIALSLVDNIQETFGLSILEAMAAGLPVVASNWNGYRDLICDKKDGFLISTCWSTSAKFLSRNLGWQQWLGMQSFPGISGSLA